jgi:hypothetical protein
VCVNAKPAPQSAAATLHTGPRTTHNLISPKPTLTNCYRWNALFNNFLVATTVDSETSKHGG